MIILNRGAIKEALNWCEPDSSSSKTDIESLIHADLPLEGSQAEEVFTLTIDLLRDPALIFSEFKKDARNNIRKSERDDQLIYEDFWDASLPLREFLDVFREFSRWKGLPAKTNLRAIVAYAKSGRLMLSRVSSPEGQVVSWHAFVLAKKQIVFLHSAFDPRIQVASQLRGRANRLHHWRDILKSKEAGYSIYDFGGWYSGLEDAALLDVNRFKEEFGGKRVKKYNSRRAQTFLGRAFLAAVNFKARLRGFSKKPIERNKQTYSDAKTVECFASARELQKPEATIFKICESEFPKMKVLDLGVGGGRTTLHLKDRVLEYWGGDYAEPMITYCKSIFQEVPGRLQFRILDVRDLSALPKNYFDFILFSFNGIDYISHDERRVAFQEIKKVCAPGGLFCFSTHNLLTAGELLKMEQTRSLFSFLKQAIRVILTRLLNENFSNLLKRPFAMINDGAHRFGLRTYYVRPKDQIAQLEAAGFGEIRVFDYSRGLELGLEDLDQSRDPWLYYLCRKRAA